MHPGWEWLDRAQSRDITEANVLLQGVVGSHAYGLNNEDSDIDRLGVYAAATREFHGLHPPMDRAATLVRSGPDITMHEALKFAKLCLGGNPTVTELLWLDEYEVKTDLGNDLLSIRTAFLSRKRVADAYIGYAMSQFKRLTDTGQFQSKQRARAEKHSRHMLRLFDQGLELYRTGTLTLKVTNPEWYRETGAQIAANPDLALPFLVKAKEDFENSKSPLPERPDDELVQSWVLRVRTQFL